MRYLNRISFYLILSVCNKILHGTHFFGLKRLLFNSIGIRVGHGSSVVGPINIGSMADLQIGTGNWVGSNLTVYGNGKVTIGNNNDLAPDVTFVTGSHELGDQYRRAGSGVSHNFSIGNGNWLGAKTTFINGSSVGSGVVVGVCSLVTKPLEDNHIYVGIPAKVTESLST